MRVGVLYACECVVCVWVCCMGVGVLYGCGCCMNVGVLYVLYGCGCVVWVWVCCVCMGVLYLCVTGHFRVLHVVCNHEVLIVLEALAEELGAEVGLAAGEPVRRRVIVRIA